MAARVEGWVTQIGGPPDPHGSGGEARPAQGVRELSAPGGLHGPDGARGGGGGGGSRDILLLAAGGFRDQTRLASSNPSLWSDILLATDERIVGAIDSYVTRLQALRDEILAGLGARVEETSRRPSERRG